MIDPFKSVPPALLEAVKGVVKKNNKILTHQEKRTKVVVNPKMAERLPPEDDVKEEVVVEKGPEHQHVNYTHQSIPPSKYHTDKNKQKWRSEKAERKLKENKQLDELSNDTIKSYTGKAVASLKRHAIAAGRNDQKELDMTHKAIAAKPTPTLYNHYKKMTGAYKANKEKVMDVVAKRERGLNMAVKKLTKEDVLTEGHMPSVNWFMAHENGDLDHDEEVKGFQKLVDTRGWQHLQGHYGRMAKALIDAGHVKDTHGDFTGKKHVNESLEEKWDSDYETPKSKRGMWDGWSLEDLRKAAKTASGTRAKEINFAIRAKTGWGGTGVKEEEHIEEKSKPVIGGDLIGKYLKKRRPSKDDVDPTADSAQSWSKKLRKESELDEKAYHPEPDHEQAKEKHRKDRLEKAKHKGE